MTHFQKAKVTEINPDHLLLELENGEKIKWHFDDQNNVKYTVGEELIMTLTSSADVINELIMDHDQDKNENQ